MSTEQMQMHVHGIEREQWFPGWVITAVLLLACLLLAVGVQAYRMDAELQAPASTQDDR